MTRTRVRIGRAGLRLAQTCCCVLVVTLAWGPHWPLGPFGLAAVPYGIFDTVFDLADVLFIGIVAGWALALVSGQDRIGLAPRWISAPLLLFALAGGLAVVGAMNQALAIHFAIRSAALAVLYLYLRRSLDARRLAPATLALWLVPGLAFNGLLAIAQTVHQSSLGLTWLGEPTRLPTTPGLPVVLVHGTRVMRAFGLLPHANVLGGLLAAGLPFVMGLLLRPNASGRAGRGCAGRDGLLLLSMALMVAGIVLSFSRSAWLGLLCGGLYLLVRRLVGARTAIPRSWTKRGVLLAASIALVAGGVLVVEWDAVSVRLQPASNALERASIQQRLTLLELSVKVISLRPLTGVGGGNYALAANQFLPPDEHGQSTFNRVHNTYLMAQAELGILGAAAWLALMLVPVLGLTRRRRSPPAEQVTSAVRAGSLPLAGGAGHEAPAWTGPAGCSLVVVAVVGLVDWYIWINEPAAVLWIVALALFAAPMCQDDVPVRAS